MLELEKRAHDTLPSAAKRKRYLWLIEHRAYLARISGELCCWGVSETPSLERQLGLVEDSIYNLIPDSALAAELSAEYVVADSELIHVRGRPPEGFDCAVCRSGGRFGIEDMLARLPDYLG